MALNGEVTQQIWDEELGRLMQLSASTLKRSSELEARVVQLQRELSFWQSSHAHLREAAEYATTTHDVVSLKRQLYASPHHAENRSLVLCVIDGGTAFIKDSFITQGFQGGQAAAQDLTRAIAEYLTNEGVQITLNTISFWTTIFFNKASLLAELLAENVCSEIQFVDFMSGFSQASTRFAIVDVGTCENQTEAKIREYLETYTRFPQTLRIFVGGSLNNNYIDTLRSLEVEQILSKVVRLVGNKDDELRRFPPVSLPVLEIMGLFRPPTRRPPKRSLPSIVTDNSLTVSTNGGLISPKSPPRSARLIDPGLPLHKQNPPPCNEFYLMNCSKGPALCKYSHDYLLTPDQLACLASNAKKAPCNWLKSGLQCPYGDKCCWGHVCPNGPKCFHLSQGKCWFKGAALHTPALSSSPDA